MIQFATVGYANEKAVLKIDVSQRCEYPVPRYITGKFAEHLYFNVTNGMDAQILRNPTLTNYPFRAGGKNPDGVATFHFDPEQIDRILRERAGGWGWPETEIEAMIQSRHQAVACWWTKQGPVEASPDTGPHGGRAQRIDTNEPGQGIAQWTWLPLHRVRRYQFEIWARSPDIETLSAELPWAKNTLENPEAIAPTQAKHPIENGTLSMTIKPYTVLHIKIDQSL